MFKVLIAYDTRTGNTDQMAQAVAEGAKSVDDVEVILKKVKEIGSELADADAIIIGAPTQSKQPSKAMKEFLPRLNKVSLKDKVGAAFGSYGWSGEAPGIIEKALRNQGMHVVAEALLV
ncbi:MAG: flavodoxin domain-containing protein, partial [Chloroflexota bacterium]|nr:flavodoxin domain-containing protein [Chloroflexota bacterium]